MPYSLPFLQDPERFLRSYFWGCNQGHTLSGRCRQQLDQVLPVQSSVHASNFQARFSDQIIESLLDCYVHTKVCSRCKAIEKVTCQQGYELMKARDTAFDKTCCVEFEGRGDSPSEGRIEVDFDMEFAQQQLLIHMNGCQECTIKQPRGRYNLAVWNIDAARSQRF